VPSSRPRWIVGKANTDGSRPNDWIWLFILKISPLLRSIFNVLCVGGISAAVTKGGRHPDPARWILLRILYWDSVNTVSTTAGPAVGDWFSDSTMILLATLPNAWGSFSIPKVSGDLRQCIPTAQRRTLRDPRPWQIGGRWSHQRGDETASGTARNWWNRCELVPSLGLVLSYVCWAAVLLGPFKFNMFRVQIQYIAKNCWICIPVFLHIQ